MEILISPPNKQFNMYKEELIKNLHSEGISVKEKYLLVG